MTLDFAILAQAVSLAGDKLYIHGAPLRRIDVPQLPWAAAMGVGLSFSAELDEAGDTHELRLVATGPPSDGQLIETAPLPLVLPDSTNIPTDYERLNVLAAFDFGVIGFAHEGWYTFQVTVDDVGVASLRLRIVVVPELQDRLRTHEALQTEAPPED